MRIKNVFCIGVILLCLVGCGRQVSSDVDRDDKEPELEAVQAEEVDDRVIDKTVGDSLFIVESMDMEKELISLYSIEEHRNLQYHYNMTTSFLDKYGKNMSWAKFVVGSVVKLGNKLPSSGALAVVQMADDVWVYEDVAKFKIDALGDILTIGDSKYRLLSNTKVYSGEEQILVNEIENNDILTVVGKDKDILSISITTGQGYVDLKNTELFYKSHIFIGNKIISTIYGDCTLQIQEGTYRITVANDGWGGSGIYTIKRNETTVVDLDDLKGEGPSFCELSFIVTVPDTFVYIDGKLVDTSEVVQVKYGSHKLTVNCEGYNSWNKTLVVNSESATITLEMEESTKADSAASNQQASPQENTNNDSGQLNNNNKLNNSENSDDDPENKSTNPNKDYDYESDYLSTISDLLSNIMN